MSLVQACASWLRHNFAWSNSRESWIERGAAVGLVLAGLAIWWFASRVPPALTLTSCGLLALGAALLLRRGWLKLFGPVLFYDMIRAARRSRYFLLRFLYA